MISFIDQIAFNPKNHVRGMHFLALVLLASLAIMVSGFMIRKNSSQSAMPAAKSAPQKKVIGYMQDNEPDFHLFVPPYPVQGSKQDDADVTGSRFWQQPEDSPRWKLALADNTAAFSRFDEVFGSDIDVASTPLLVNLLARTDQDVAAVAAQAKSFYSRPRPFQRFQMEHVCGMHTAPKPESSPKTGTSYPSGHAAYGWTLALVLADVVPERAQALLARGNEFADSRIVCAVHFPSDVQASQILAASVIARLHFVPDFQRDMTCAKQEHAVALKTLTQLSSDCAALKKQIGDSVVSLQAP